jgi:carbon-monoxide dehydrogenase small subunit
MRNQVIGLRVNGETCETLIKPSSILLNVLREKLGLTGAKHGCDNGQCGACTVLLDGEPIRSCLTLAIRVSDREITTIEGIADDGNLHPLQRAFIDHGAVQCGFCIPGMILFAKSFLAETPEPTEEQIKEALSGNICRCTGYLQIVEAIQAAATDQPRARAPGEVIS